eukprot:gnl/TRDRNA2_/TRDRNA2_160000_c0_seq1.p1 gnl/TRDRNA2_/TRDRNA2_160000_c0~~gnl/TRDRNA2_/TRDRNA2_160000_c0_seq1.p1  ORF type:complete len:289 (+),score=17.68 gnl/TRDRNA2_/TRDRNA2_160000_c0_seq1:28-894(+)
MCGISTAILVLSVVPLNANYRFRGRDPAEDADQAEGLESPESSGIYVRRSLVTRVLNARHLPKRDLDATTLFKTSAEVPPRRCLCQDCDGRGQELSAQVGVKICSSYCKRRHYSLSACLETCRTHLHRELGIGGGIQGRRLSIELDLEQMQLEDDYKQLRKIMDMLPEIVQCAFPGCENYTKGYKYLCGACANKTILNLLTNGTTLEGLPVIEHYGNASTPEPTEIQDFHDLWRKSWLLSDSDEDDFRDLEEEAPSNYDKIMLPDYPPDKPPLLSMSLLTKLANRSLK